MANDLERVGHGAGSFNAAETEPVAIIRSQAFATSAKSWLIFCFLTSACHGVDEKGVAKERPKEFRFQSDLCAIDLGERTGE